MIPASEEWIKALTQRHGAELQRKFLSATVAICGLGGLGSNISNALARAGIGRLILIDFDRVDITNLHRQQYKVKQIGMYKTDASAENIREISPYTEVEIHTERIDENNAKKLLKSADVICEAFDNAECKAMLVNLVLESMREKYIVSASGMAGIASANDIRTRKISEKFYLCGDEVSELTEDTALLSSRVMLCAAHQANAVLRILANEFEA